MKYCAVVCFDNVTPIVYGPFRETEETEVLARVRARHPDARVSWHPMRSRTDA